MGEGWKPIFEGEAATRATEIVQVIADALRRPPPPYNGNLEDRALAVALLSREPGFALLFAYLARATGRDEYAELAQQHIASAVESLPLAMHRPYFAYGIAGLAWAMQHLDGWIIEADAEGLDEIDAAIRALVDAPFANPDYGLAKGLVGYAIYALERSPRPTSRATLERIVERLVASAERTTDGIAWRVPAERVSPQLEHEWPDGMQIVGVLDGNAGVIAALAAASAAGASPDLADRTIADAIRWLAAQRIGAGDELDLPHVAGGKRVPPSWAYSAVGVAAALVATGRSDVRELGLALGRAAACRDSEIVRDASLFRGAAGVAHSFNRLYQMTGEELFRAAAQRWLGTVLAMHRPGVGFGGYRFWGDEWIKQYIPELDVGWVDQPGVLEGVAGVGLVLLAATTPIAPDWDRILLLSRRGGS